MIDYRDLLKKYIRHVAREEGTHFLEGWRLPVGTSKEERAELLRAAAEALDDR